MCVRMYIYVYIYTHRCIYIVCIYTYIYIERDINSNNKEKLVIITNNDNVNNGHANNTNNNNNNNNNNSRHGFRERRVSAPRKEVEQADAEQCSLRGEASQKREAEYPQTQVRETPHGFILYYNIVQYTILYYTIYHIIDMILSERSPREAPTSVLGGAPHPRGLGGWRDAVGTLVECRPFRAVRSRAGRIPGSRNSRASHRTGELHPSKIRICSGRAPELPESCSASQARHQTRAAGDLASRRCGLIESDLPRRRTLNDNTRTDT